MKENWYEKNRLNYRIQAVWNLVRPMRVELIWIAPPPPQDGASTNFATAANFSDSRLEPRIEVSILARNLICLGVRIRRCLILINRLRLFYRS